MRLRGFSFLLLLYLKTWGQCVFLGLVWSSEKNIREQRERFLNFVVDTKKKKKKKKKKKNDVCSIKVLFLS
jgi:hypothetical protein